MQKSSEDDARRQESSDSEESSGESEASAPVESLVRGREKRATAGNRLSILVDKEQDDDLQLLFAENELEEDESFDEDEENGSDSNLGSSSSDEEDANAAKEGGEFQGEEELQRQARQENKKRKARAKAKMPGVVRKKVKIDPTAIKAPTFTQPRQQKKSERTSWIATAADAPTRVSSRKQTIVNRETVHQRLVDSEKQRKKIMTQMKEAQVRKEASKPKALTQAQRMEEAVRMEKKNAKSLTRWEESEKQRVAEQKAKLEALHNRQLSGPVISWWSGMAKWVNGKIAQLGYQNIRQTESAEDTRDQGATVAMEVTVDMPGSPSDIKAKETANKGDHEDVNVGAVAAHVSPDAAGSQTPHTIPAVVSTMPKSQGLPGGVHAYSPRQSPHDTAHPSTSTTQAFSDPYASAAPPTPTAVSLSSRDLIVLKNVDGNASKPPELQDSVLMKRQKIKMPKVVLDPCVVTGQPARYRDPWTGLPYANTYAFKEIRRLGKDGPRWSNLLECYVGVPTTVANGVPERFRQPP